MASYFVGEQLHVDMPDDPYPEGIPIVDEFNEEAYVLPEDFDHLGRPEADAMRFQPDPDLVPEDYLAVALTQLKFEGCTAEQLATGAMILAGVEPLNPDGQLIALAENIIENDIREKGEQ